MREGLSASMRYSNLGTEENEALCVHVWKMASHNNLQTAGEQGQRMIPWLGGPESRPPFHANLVQLLMFGHGVTNVR